MRQGGKDEDDTGGSEATARNGPEESSPLSSRRYAAVEPREAALSDTAARPRWTGVLDVWRASRRDSRQTTIALCTDAPSDCAWQVSRPASSCPRGMPHHAIATVRLCRSADWRFLRWVAAFHKKQPRHVGRQVPDICSRGSSETSAKMGRHQRHGRLRPAPRSGPRSHREQRRLLDLDLIKNRTKSS